jgi:iron(III) transport system ATP-binding protein
MSMIFQSYAIWPNMTVGQNVGFGLEVRKVSGAEYDRRVNAILDIVQLRHLKDRYPAELSGGQQQRVALARAIVVEPEVLLLDEPLSNLDANLREEMRFEIRRLHDRYRYTTVYVTHDQAEAMTTADLIAVMNHGKVEQLGPPEEIYSRPRSEFVARFIGGANILRGSALDEARVSVAGSTLRTTGRPLTAGKPVALSVRQHEIAIAAEKPQSATDNHLNAVVTRQVFLGSARDYTVALDDKTELRVTAPPGRNIAPGERVWLHLPAEQVRALAEE